MVFKLAAVTVAFAAAAAGAATIKRVTCADGNVTSNAACCKFFPLRADLEQNLFKNECGEEVHEALRLTFHDAIGFSRNGSLKGAGADGSIIIFKDIELPFAANAGIDDPVEDVSPFIPKHPDVTVGDPIQFSGALGITNCPGAPKLQFLAGRPNATFPASDLTVPLPESNVDLILSRMNDAGISDLETVHLLASHTVARSDTLVPGHQDVPFDTTPFTFDTQIFLEVLLKGVGVPFGVNNTDGAEVDSPVPSSGEMRLQSDFAISRDARTACEWQAMINNQKKVMTDFKNAMAKMAILGHNADDLIDCSDVLPDPLPPVDQPATFPAGTSRRDVQQACPQPFPALPADPGQASVIPGCPDGTLDPDDCS